jgi:hypothetical protein
VEFAPEADQVSADLEESVEPPATATDGTEYSEDREDADAVQAEQAVTDRAQPIELLEAREPVEAVEPVEPVEPVELLEPDPRYSRLGADGLRRLRARYADVVSRLEAAPVEEAQRTELQARARRLDPDGWTTADEVAAALEEYESVFESLRAVVGRHPRRKR